MKGGAGKGVLGGFHAQHEAIIPHSAHIGKTTRDTPRLFIATFSLYKPDFNSLKVLSHEIS